MVDCTDVAIFWEQFGKMWKRIFEFWFKLNEIDILFGIQNDTCDEIVDTLKYHVLFAKFDIYRSRKNERKVFSLNLSAF